MYLSTSETEKFIVSENNRHPAKMHRNNTAVVFFSRHILEFPDIFPKFNRSDRAGHPAQRKPLRQTMPKP